MSVVRTRPLEVAKPKGLMPGVKVADWESNTVPISAGLAGREIGVVPVPAVIAN